MGDRVAAGPSSTVSWLLYLIFVRLVGVEPVGDGLVAEPLGDPPAEDAPHDRGLDRVGAQVGLLRALARSAGTGGGRGGAV